MKLPQDQGALPDSQDQNSHGTPASISSPLAPLDSSGPPGHGAGKAGLPGIGEATPAAGSHEALSHLRVLVVEDDVMTRMLIKTLLAREGHRGLEAGTAGEALSILSTIKVDLVLIDVRLPDMCGIDLARCMKDDPRTATTPMIICSAVADRDTVVQAVALKVAGYLLKPITSEKLFGKIAEIEPRMVPALEPPQKVTQRLGIGMLEYRRLLSAMQDEIGQSMGNLRVAALKPDLPYFDFVTYRLSASASQLGARAFATAAMAAREAAPRVSAAEMEKHLMNMYNELVRLQEVVQEQYSLKNSLKNTLKRREEPAIAP